MTPATAARTTPTLAVVGAGPKAIAVAAKAAELRQMGVTVPDVVAVERSTVGANWQAVGGWTDGQHRLGTSPEKDVGFPYRSSLVPRRNAELERTHQERLSALEIAYRTRHTDLERQQHELTLKREQEHAQRVAHLGVVHVVAGHQHPAG